MKQTQVRACVVSVLLLWAGALLVYGSAFHQQDVLGQDVNDLTVTQASEFALNRAVAAGALFRDAFGTLRIKPSRACPT